MDTNRRKGRGRFSKPRVHRRLASLVNDFRTYRNNISASGGITDTKELNLMSFFDAIGDTFDSMSDFMGDVMSDPLGLFDLHIETDGPAVIDLHIDDDPTLGDDGWY